MNDLNKVKIPMQPIYDDRLSTGALGVYGLICRFNQSDQLRATTVKSTLLMKRLHVGWESLKKVLIELHNAGYIDQSWYEQDCVYLIAAKVVGLYKIGKAKDVGKRFSELNRASPVSLTLIDAIATCEKDELEKLLHNRFAPLRRRFEWFELSVSEIDYFAGLHK